ncbi:OCIA domain-containing protein 1 [Diabrotica virgifera virgifera]|uniref:OCIA domain-containing protein n=1 Tax=Diabrotica virgifera virgifera TaxID=50390 RepID=A0ABM5JU11_DIAVI|nr:OCIA domain-containing protein 1 [Diabrotica virgifera virgifera]
MINPETENGNVSARQRPDPRSRYEFTPEELRVLKECNRESFYNRCLPISAFLAGSTYYGVKAGFLRGNPRFGATPKVFVAVAVGYFLGKFSYQSKCAEKLMQLPNSQIGEMLRQKRRGNLKESIDTGFGPSLGLAPFSSINPADTYSDISPYSSLDLDTSRPENPGLDDYHRPSLDNPAVETLEEMPPEQKISTSYEELRKKNREEYIQKRTGGYKEPPVRVTEPSFLSPRQEKSTNTNENKYGDTWG